MFRLKINLSICRLAINWLHLLSSLRCLQWLLEGPGVLSNQARAGLGGTPGSRSSCAMVARLSVWAGGQGITLRLPRNLAACVLYLAYGSIPNSCDTEEATQGLVQQLDDHEA